MVAKGKPGPKKAGFRKWRDIFGYHYRSNRVQCCKTCRFVKWWWIKKFWSCRLQGHHRIGPFWVCSKWKKILVKGK